MKISSTGDGLNILIVCDYLTHHDWMSFICWYSISKNLPDANVFVTSNRNVMNYDLFNWTRRCKVPLFLHKSTDTQGQIDCAINHGVKEPILVIGPEVICIRDFEESGINSDFSGVKMLDDDLSCDCKQDRSCVFVTYSKGWGNFVTASWINKMGCPFISDIKHAQGNLTVNENRIEKLWISATPLFQIVSRG